MTEKIDCQTRKVCRKCVGRRGREGKNLQKRERQVAVDAGLELDLDVKVEF
jgi:hypothetical protein